MTNNEIYELLQKHLAKIAQYHPRDINLRQRQPSRATRLENANPKNVGRCIHSVRGQLTQVNSQLGIHV